LHVHHHRLVTDSNLEPFFPPELEREIFETAAMRDPTSIPVLLRVCHRAHAWVEPLLYRVLTIDNGSSSILRAAEAKSASFLHIAVRHVYLERPVELSEPRKMLLRKCTGAIDLYFDTIFEIDFFDLGPTRLLKLSLSVPSNVSTRRQLLQHPNLRPLTHLDLYEPADVRPTWEDWSALAALPALTHLCLSREFPSDVLIRAMKDCPRLAVAVRAFWGGLKEREDAISSARNIATITTDPRIVVLVVSSYDEDWGVGARGGEDCWIHAEAFIAEKRRGKIDKGCYFLDDVNL
ncbi:hypothetical protein DFH06DRAFT_724320, partial [Mycena polygramma]